VVVVVVVVMVVVMVVVVVIVVVVVVLMVVVVVVAAVELVFTVRYRGLCCSKMSARLPFRLSHISIMSKRLDIILIFFTIGQPHHSIAFIARHHTDVRY